ncbi:MAG TPA: SMC-Scp complex subunit ScpB [Terriglobales bacterium]|nr:SMC-Scp complex subunit ScpB [Terriglobales bacterium]
MSELISAIEAIVYAAEEPATPAQMAAALGVERSEVEAALKQLAARYASDDFGMELRQIAGGYRMATKPHHHDSVRQFLKSLKPKVRLSLPALETLAVIAYRQPVTLPEIREIRGVDAAGVINTLLEKKLVTTAGRKEALGKPILYRTTKEFLVQFGLSSVRDLPTLKEFEEMAQAGLEGLEAAPAAAVTAAADLAGEQADSSGGEPA